MKRYDFERYEKKKRNCKENRYYIFDRIVGTTFKIATVYDALDAEMICDALNRKDTHNGTEASRYA